MGFLKSKAFSDEYNVADVKFVRQGKLVDNSTPLKDICKCTRVYLPHFLLSELQSNPFIHVILPSARAQEDTAASEASNESLL